MGTYISTSAGAITARIAVECVLQGSLLRKSQGYKVSNPSFSAKNTAIKHPAGCFFVYPHIRTRSLKTPSACALLPAFFHLDANSIT